MVVFSARLSRLMLVFAWAAYYQSHIIAQTAMHSTRRFFQLTRNQNLSRSRKMFAICFRSALGFQCFCLHFLDGESRAREGFKALAVTMHSCDATDDYRRSRILSSRWDLLAKCSFWDGHLSHCPCRLHRFLYVLVFFLLFEGGEYTSEAPLVQCQG